MQEAKPITPDIVTKVAESGDVLNSALVDYMTFRARAPDVDGKAARDYLCHSYSVCTRNMDIRAPAYAWALKVGSGGVRVGDSTECSIGWSLLGGMVVS